MVATVFMVFAPDNNPQLALAGETEEELIGLIQLLFSVGICRSWEHLSAEGFTYRQVEITIKDL